jgi:hypothetical protein
MATACRSVEDQLETLAPRWDLIIVAAAGPSLTREVAEACSKYPTIAIKQAALLMPWASVVYVCNAWQWQVWRGFPGFKGERWSLYHPTLDDKSWIAKQYDLRLVRGDGVRAGRFSTDPSVVNYGMCSGFVGVGLAIHWLRKPGRIVLVGFDFREVNGRLYWNGQHPNGRGGGQFHTYMPQFEEAAKCLPQGVEIINATPGSALECFPFVDLEDACRTSRRAPAVNALQGPPRAASAPRGG